MRKSVKRRQPNRADLEDGSSFAEDKDSEQKTEEMKTLSTPNENQQKQITDVISNPFMQIPAFSSILRQQSIKKSEKRRNQATEKTASYKRFAKIPKYADDDNYILSESISSSSELSSYEEDEAGKRLSEK